MLDNTLYQKQTIDSDGPQLNQWLPKLNAMPSSKARLFCFAFAGGGASVYSPWQSLLGDHIEVCPIQLPGREERIRETCLTSIDDVLDQLMPLMTSSLDKPFLVYGHSLGAHIAYAFIDRIKREFGKSPQAFLVGAQRSPDIPYPYPSVLGATQQQLHQVLSKFDGMTARVMQSEELMELMMPVIKADLQLCESLQYCGELALDGPVIAFRGTRDRAISAACMAGWSQHSKNQYQYEEVDGDHFFLKTHGNHVVEKIRHLAQFE
ncbi:MAG: surfactin synthase thioesterase subunit [Arenicella sp.]|jgi:surfactin synthase thioesterase subunit